MRERGVKGGIEVRVNSEAADGWGELRGKGDRSRKRFLLPRPSGWVNPSRPEHLRLDKGAVAAIFLT